MKKRGKYIAHRKRYSDKPVIFLVTILFLIVISAFCLFRENIQKIQEPLILVKNDSPEYPIATFKPIIVNIPENLQTTEEEPVSVSSLFQIRCEHLPQAATYLGYADAYQVCVDPIEMQQGSHYAIFSVDHENLVFWDNHTFAADVHLMGQDVPLKFEYAVQNENVVITHTSVGLIDNGIRFFHDTSQGIHQVLVGINLTLPDGRFLHYPIFLDLETGAVTDFLVGINLDTWYEVFSTEIYPIVPVEEGRFLLGRQNADSSYSYFWLDIAEGKLVDLEEVSGKEMADGCILEGEIICWNDDGEFWSICTDNWETAPLIHASDVEFSSGVFHNSSGQSCSFFLYRDDTQVLHLYDFLTKEDTIVEEPDDWNFEPRVFRSWSYGRMLCVPCGNGAYLNLDADTCSFKPIEPLPPNLQLWEKSAPWELVFVSDDKKEYYFCKLDTDGSTT